MQRTKKVCRIPCECRDPYIRETDRLLQVRTNRNLIVTSLGEMDKSRLAQYTWGEKHGILFDKAALITRDHKRTEGSIQGYSAGCYRYNFCANRRPIATTGS